MGRKLGFDLIPSKEAATEAFSLQWSREKKDDSDLNEKELNIVNNKSEKRDHKHSVSDEKSKECES